MATIYRHWKPIKSPDEHAGLINAVMMLLSVYGYGALPSDPLQSKAKITGFCKMLEECPLWAVEVACEKWMKEKKEPPTPSELLARAKHEMGWYMPFMGDKIAFGDEPTGRVYEKLVNWVKDNKHE